ncbi:MAG: M28 family peptidase, partial [Christensenellales bacterium]
LNPGSFYGWIYFTVTAGIISLAVYFFAPLIALALLIVALIPMVSQFVLYRQVFDPLFKEATSCNVTAIKKPAGAVKRRIIFCGHADAANEWPINYYLGGKAFSFTFVVLMLGILYLTSIYIAALAIDGIAAKMPVLGTTTIMGLAGLAFLPFFIALYFFSNKKVVVDGANDNLTACYLSIALLKYLADNGITPENTEVGVLITGSEEAGLRGAKAWAAAHKDEYRDVPTFFVAYDTIADLDCLYINNKDLNGLVPTDKDVNALLMEASDNTAAGATFNKVTVGSTDSAAFTQAGLKSACITGADHSLKPYYHTRRDSYELINKEALSKVFELSAEAIRLVDSGKYDSASVKAVTK